MAQLLKISRSIIRYRPNTFSSSTNHQLYWLSFVRNIIRSCNVLQTEQHPQLQVPPLPHYLRPYAFDTPEGVLSYTEHNSYTFRDNVGMLKSLRVQVQLKKTDIQDLQDRISFQILLSSFVKSCHLLTSAQLISGLRSLLEIGVPPKCSDIVKVEDVILNKVKDFSMTELIGCLHLHKKYLVGDVQKGIASSLVNEVTDRTDEISTLSEVLMLIQTMQLFDKKSADKIGKKLKSVIESFSVQDLTRIICTISETSNRNKPLLDAASYCLKEKVEKPNIKDTVNLLHAMSSLNYFDCKLLSHLTTDSLKDISSVEQPSLISALLTVCGHLKWKHSEILDACSQWISDHMDICSSREFVSFILTAAALNYVPRNNTFLKNMLTRLNFESVGSKDVWLDVVWSLSVLNYTEKELLVKVLSPEFHNSLLDNMGFSTMSNSLKLMNLKHTLKNLHPEYVFSCDLFLEAQEGIKSKESENSRKEVLDALSNLVPEKSFMCLNITTDTGVFIDAEFIMNKKGKPLKLDTYGLMSKPSVVNKKLPRGAQRIALKILQFRDYTLNERTLTGVNAMAERLLSSQGYVVCEVPYDEFARLRTSVKKVVYLSELLTKTLAESKNKAIVE